MSRMAAAMETIASYMPALISALEPVKPVKLEAPAVPTVPKQSSASGHLKTTVVAAAPKPFSSEPGPSESLAVEAEVDIDFDYGVGNASDVDSEAGVDPKERCGVCKAPCKGDMIALDCGHYPYCGDCVKTMEKKAGPWQKDYKLQCPY